MATPSTPLPARAPIGLPDLAESSFAIEQPGRSDVEWFVQRLTAQPASPGTSETLRRSVLHEAAAEMARWLIDDALDQDGSPVMDVDVAPAAWADELPGFVVRFRSEPDRSAAALAECGRALRALHVSEFSARLLGRVRERKLAQFERDLGRSGRVENVVLARWLAVCIADRVVPCALSFLLQRRRAAWNELTAEACAVEWFTAWGDEQPSILTIGPPGHGIDTSAVWQRIAAVAAATGPEDLAALRDAQAASGDSAVAVAAAADWPYASSPVAPAEVSLQRRHDNALDLDDLQFANGVRVLVKATDFARDQILIAVCVGAGQSHLTDDERQAARLFDLMVPEAGLRRLAAAELRLVASTRDARVSVRTEPGRFLLRGACDRASLAFQFEWLVAQLSEPRFDAVVHRRVCASHRSEFAPTRASATSVEMEFSSRLTGQPVGYAPARVAAVDLDAVRALFAAHWRDEPITVVVVGDLDVEQTIGLVAQTFGRRPLCRPAAEPAANVDDRAAPNVLHEVHEIAASETSSAVTVLAPLPDLRGVAMSRALVLALIVQDRLRAMLRESMGATYAGRAEVYEFATASRALVIRAAAKVAPGREQDVRDAMLHVLAAMGSDGVTAVELDGVRALVQNELRAQDRNNDYWCQRLSLVHREPAMLHEWTASADDLETLTAADLSALAATYFAPGRLSSLVLKAEPR
jgi:zinc protease